MIASRIPNRRLFVVASFQSARRYRARAPSRSPSPRTGISKMASFFASHVST